MKSINFFWHSKFLGRIFHSLDYCLRKELSDCQSVLDLGCGPSSPIKNCANIKYSIGVDAFDGYIEKSRLEKIHNEYMIASIKDVEFTPKSFDAVIMIEVLEHLSREEGLKVLKKAEKWARKKIIISTPNGFFGQGSVDGNERQKHLSGWDEKYMKELGYGCSGLAGLKFFRVESDSQQTKEGPLTSIRFRPKLFWFFFAALSQIIAFFIPSCAFGLFCVKKIK